jgi:hypothetical protein
MCIDASDTMLPIIDGRKSPAIPRPMLSSTGQILNFAVTACVWMGNHQEPRL